MIGDRRGAIMMKSPGSTLNHSSDWLVPLGQHHPQAQIDLFCFPPAGAGALFFRQWPAHLPEWINLWAVRFPGRETRLREPLLTQWSEIIDPLVQDLDQYLDQRDRPYALFGHSVGSLASFEVAHHLSSRPTALLISSRQPPHLPTIHRPYQREDHELIAELRSDGSTPEAVLQDREMMALILPIYRADLQLNMEYTYRDRDPLTCPILTLGGETDSMVKPADLAQWQRHTDQRFEQRIFPGGHMYLSQDQERAAMIQSLAEFMIPALNT